MLAAHTVQKCIKCWIAENASPGSSHREKRNSLGSDLHSHKTKPAFTGIKGIYMEEPKNLRAPLAKRHSPNAGFVVNNL